MAMFDYAVKYAVKATCVSPLRTGGTEGSIGRGFLTDGALAVRAGGKTCTLRFAEDGRTICTGDSSAAEEWLRTLEGGGQA